MVDKNDNSDMGKLQPPPTLTRREAIGAGLAVAGGVSAEDVTARTTASPVGSGQSIPQADRGYFRSGDDMFIPRGQGFDSTNAKWYEVPLEDPDYLEIWCYTDKLSYLPGEEVQFHTSTTGKQFSIEILREGGNPASIHTIDALQGKMHKLRPDFFEKGCGWPVSYRWVIPDDLPSGFYIVLSRTASDAVSLTMRSYDAAPQTEVREHQHGFFVRRAPGRARSDILFISSTCTWTAYNDWGGFSHYVGYHLTGGYTHAPRLSIHRPFAKGIIWAPEGAPRKPHHFEIQPNSIPLYPVLEFAYARGYSKFYSNCGWATYEKPFATFAEGNGFAMDYATQIDLHCDPHLLDGYKCVVMVGHCEYWTWEMREAIERFVDKGGNLARFAAGNSNQIRLEDDGRIQIAYKDRAHDCDPVRNTKNGRRLSTYWDDPDVAWPAAATFGLNATFGVYAHVGVNVPRGTGGFTVYRPDHWAFSGTDLYYGDTFGASAKIFGYEVDGLDYTFRDGLPHPTFKDGAPQGVEILAMALASNTEPDHKHRGSVFYYGDGSEWAATYRYGKVTKEAQAAAARGSGMIVTFQRGRGAVFHAGTCEWVAGLERKDYCTETITRNVLKHFTGRR